MKVICISGKARHGKDTAAEYISAELTNKSYRVLVTHYGDLLKYICKTFFGWNGEKDEQGRQILQYVGTDIIRVKAPDYWVNFVADMLEFFKGNWDYVIIPDSRFPNEIDSLKERGFDVCSLRVIRDGFISDLTEEQLKHISEVALDDYRFDCVIHNSNSLENFYKKLSSFTEELEKSENAI